MSKVAPWTDEQVQYLRENYFHMTPEQLESGLGRTWSGIRKKANNLRLYKKAPVARAEWTREQIDLICAEYRDGDLDAICAAIGRTRDQLREKANHLGLHRSDEARYRERVKQSEKARAARGRIYSDEELALEQRIILTTAKGFCRNVAKAIAQRTPLELAWAGNA